jgi:hypothetical protein
MTFDPDKLLDHASQARDDAQVWADSKNGGLLAALRARDEVCLTRMAIAARQEREG